MKLQERCDLKEFKQLLSDAEVNASTNWEMDFCADIRERFDVYQGTMFFTDRQDEILRRIAKW